MISFATPAKSRGKITRGLAMAKSLRSKSRQKALSVRRKKYRERERLKAWDHYRQIQAREETTMQTGEQQETSENSTEMMESGMKISQKEISKWASRNSKKRQRKRLKAQAKINRRKTHTHNKNRRREAGDKMEL